MTPPPHPGQCRLSMLGMQENAMSVYARAARREYDVCNSSFLMLASNRAKERGKTDW